jgi:hypothetical protein
MTRRTAAVRTDVWQPDAAQHRACRHPRLVSISVEKQHRRPDRRAQQSLANARQPGCGVRSSGRFDHRGSVAGLPDAWRSFALPSLVWCDDRSDMARRRRGRCATSRRDNLVAGSSAHGLVRAAGWPPRHTVPAAGRDIRRRERAKRALSPRARRRADPRDRPQSGRSLAIPGRREAAPCLWRHSDAPDPALKARAGMPATETISRTECWKRSGARDPCRRLVQSYTTLVWQHHESMRRIAIAGGVVKAG